MSRKTVLVSILCIVALNGIVLFPSPLAARALAAFLLAVPVTGYLASVALGLGHIVSRLEQALLSLGVGYCITVAVMLLVSCVPGAVVQWQTLAAFDLVAFGLLVAVLLRGESDTGGPRTDIRKNEIGPGPPISSGWLWLGIATLVATASFLRLPNLSYSEFQDDEVSVVWHSAEVIQGRGDALFVHDKGPAEILLTTAIYSQADRLNESSARLPFAVANVVALLALFWLGWRFFGPVAGWAAAMTLAVDGYFIGFSRIVQYQSLVFLMVVLVVGVLYHYVENPRSSPVFAYLAAVFFATGVLAHYEAAIVILPAGYLVFEAVRRDDSTLRSARNVLLPSLLALALLVLFYAPFSLHPRFDRTFSEITENRIGAGFPYNNLADFFTRTIIYSSTYYFAFVVVSVAAALVLVYRRTLPRWLCWIAGVALMAGVALFFINPEWLSFSGADYAWLAFSLALVPAIIGRRITVAERATWLWFGVAVFLALFFVQKPRTHVYDFFIPMALIVGNTIALLWLALDRRFGRRNALAVAVPAATVFSLVFAIYGYWLFVHNEVEVLRTWEENRPVGYWTPLVEPRQNAIFGFPFKNGWKVVGALYAEGLLDAPFARNGKRGVANWYTRGSDECSRDAKYYVFTPWNEPTNKGLTAPPRRPTAEQGYQLIHVVTVNGESRLEIFERSRLPAASPQFHDVADYEAYFDSELSGPTFEPPGPAAWTQIDHPLEFRFGRDIWLKGYSLENNSPMPGERVDLTLYWETDSDLFESYKVFTQVIDPVSYYKAGQRDGVPGCERSPTDRWQPGDVIVDRYSIVIEEDAPQGDYTLLIGMYDSSSERLDAYSADGQPLGDALGIDTITVTR